MKKLKYSIKKYPDGSQYVIIDEFAAYHGPLTPSLKSFYQKIEEENNE